MTRFLVLVLSVVASAWTTQAQATFIPLCAGTNDTSAFISLIAVIGSNNRTIDLPTTRCAVNNLTIPANITVSNVHGDGIKVNSGQVLTVLGALVNPVGKPMFFGPGATSFVGNTLIGSNGQSLVSNGSGGTGWQTISGGGGGGSGVDSFNGRTGPVVSAVGDYTWNQINKATSSIADITLRSADLLSNGTTGTGPVVLADSPTMISPVLGAATATSLNGLTITTTTGTLTIVAGKTLTANNSLALSAAADGITLTVPATGTAVLTSRTITEGPGLAGNIYDLSANRTLALGTPSSLSVSSLTSVSGTTHSHAVASSSNPGASASLLASDSSGFVQLTRLGIATAPTQPLEVGGNVFINAATANLFMKDTSTGWQSAGTLVVTPQANNSIRSTTFTTGTTGWNVSAVGNAEFNNVDVRGAIHASVITFNALQATAGTMGIFKSAAKLRADVTIPVSPTYGTTTVSIDVDDADGLLHAASQLFVATDILRLKDGFTGDTWLRVVSASDQTSFWRYTATVMAGTGNVTYRAGMGVADYGQNGNGFIELTADKTNAPYSQMSTHGGTFSALNAGGSLVITPRQRTGNLNGSYGFATNVFGFAAGEYGTAGQSWITVDPANGVRIGNNTTVLTQVDAAGNASFTGSITASSGTIAGWTISSTALSRNQVTIAAGTNPDMTAGTPTGWFGKSADGYYGMFLKGTTSASLAIVAGNPVIGANSRPYIFVNDGTRFRIVIGELNTAVWDGTATNSMGMKIMSSSGAKLVEFSDVQNVIGGWGITDTRISAGSGSATVGLDSTVTGGDDVRIFAGNATPTSAPFRVTEAGVLTATSATITGTITASSGSVTGPLTISGVSGSLAFGSTPPTSSTNGSGLWLDRTGLYAVQSNATNLRIDSDGIAFLKGNSSNPSLKLFDFGKLVGSLYGTGPGDTLSVVLESRGSDIVSPHGFTQVIASSFDNSEQATIGVSGLDAVGASAFVRGTNFKGMVIGGGFSPTTSVMLEVAGTTGAFLPPRMTTTQRDALTPTAGALIYNTTVNKHQGYNGTSWVDFY